MAEEVKQRIRAKPQIQASAINNEDLLLMEHAPNTLEDSDKSVRMDQAKEYFIGDLEGKIQSANSRLDVVEPKVSAIENIIPNQATEDNQLADKDFVNSSVATNTANFIGSFDSLEELEAYEGTVTNNDYAFVKTIDDLGKEKDARYKYNASEEEWLFEYYLNNSSFTEAQWKAIDSGITAEKVALIPEGEVAQINDDTIDTTHAWSGAKVNSSFLEMYETYKTHYYKRGIFENTRTSGNEICVDISEVDDEWDNYDHEVLINFGMYEDGDHVCGFYSDICGDYDSSTSVSPRSPSEFRCGGSSNTRHNNIQMWIPCHRYIYQHFSNASNSATFNVMAWKRIPKTTD